jgi:hypothetical protein
MAGRRRRWPGDRRSSLGEFVILDRDGISNETWAARGVLLKTAHRLIPELVPTLQRLALERFKEFAATPAWPPYWHPQMTLADWDENCRKLHGAGGALQHRRPLRPTLEKWAGMFGLARQGWVITAGLEILRYNGDRDPEPSEVAYSVRFPPAHVRKTPALVFENPGWHPEAERWSGFAERVRRKFEENLENYRTAVSSLFPFERTRTKWTDAHFEWFVLCQLLKKRPVDVLVERAESRKDVTTITKALALVADLVEWVGPIRHLPRRSGK